MNQGEWRSMPLNFARHCAVRWCKDADHQVESDPAEMLLGTRPRPVLSIGAVDWSPPECGSSRHQIGNDEDQAAPADRKGLNEPSRP
jgi:hypothetical protein